ncbi:hypothetical protein TWF706_002038 [Orbilia oligospora]|nr:hypothetical protein TWF706_002038 [Orbilia oligospora]
MRFSGTSFFINSRRSNLICSFFVIFLVPLTGVSEPSTAGVERPLAPFNFGVGAMIIASDWNPGWSPDQGEDGRVKRLDLWKRTWDLIFGAKERERESVVVREKEGGKVEFINIRRPCKLCRRVRVYVYVDVDGWMYICMESVDEVLGR